MVHVKIIFAKGLVSVWDLRIWPVSNFSVGRNDNQMVSEAYLSLKTLRKYNYILSKIRHNVNLDNNKPWGWGMCKYQDMHMSQLILSAKKNLKKKI